MRSLGKKIRDLRQSHGLKQHELAKKIGASQGRVSKWESGEESPSTDYTVKLATEFGMSTNDFLGIMPIGQDGTSGRRIAIVGEISAGNWLDHEEWGEEDQKFVSAILPEAWSNVPIKGFIVRGRSVDKVYPDGAVVYVAPIDSVPGGPQSGEMVVAIRQDGDAFERTLKEYVVDEAGKAWLWPRSSDPEHQAPLQFRKNGRDPDSVRIAGIVIAHMALSATAARRPLD